MACIRGLHGDFSYLEVADFPDENHVWRGSAAADLLK
jgi:hypothetical protein